MLEAAPACEIVRQAALGLQHAHEKGLVHRDIKPANLMLTPQGKVVILDFGLAGIREAAGELTASGHVLGTDEFAAPEQRRDSRLADARSDVFGLGATLFALLCGHAPPRMNVGGGTVDLAAVAEKERPDLPSELRVVLARMLAASPEERFASAKEAAAALSSVAAGADLQGLAAKAVDGPDEKPADAAGEAPAATVPSPGRRRSPRWLPFVAASVAALILLVTVIVIQTAEGTIEIASDGGPLPDDVSVVVMRDGREVEVSSKDNWKISIRAGEYQIVLRGGADRLELKDRRVTVRRWDRTVVTVTHKKEAVAPPPAPDPSGADVVLLKFAHRMQMLDFSADTSLVVARWFDPPPDPFVDKWRFELWDFRDLRKPRGVALPGSGKWSSDKGCAAFSSDAKLLIYGKYPYMRRTRVDADTRPFDYGEKVVMASLRWLVGTRDAVATTYARPGELVRFDTSIEGKVARTWTLAAPVEPHVLGLSTDGKKAAVILYQNGAANAVAIVNTGDGTILQTLRREEARVFAIDLSADGKRLVTVEGAPEVVPAPALPGWNATTIRVWDLDGDKQMTSLAADEGEKLLAGLLSPDAQSLLVLAERDGVCSMRLHSVTGGKDPQRYQGDGEPSPNVRSVSSAGFHYYYWPNAIFTPDGRAIRFLSLENGGNSPTAIREWRPKLP